MKKLVVLSGAGLSAPSGIQTFRDNNGLWNQHSIDEVCDFTTWKDNREAVHNFYNGLRDQVKDVQPNAAHYMIADWSKRYPSNSTILTQNVDDLLEKADCQRVIHLHGYIKEMHCTACGHHWDVGYLPWNYETDRCVKCNSLRGVKPGVVFFNQSAPNYVYLMQAFRKLTDQDVVVVIGSSGSVLNIDSYMFDCPAYKILNNLEASESLNDSYFDKVIYKSAELAADEIDQLVKACLGQS